MAEHEAVVEIVVVHEQVACESLVVEIVGEIAHHLFDVVAVVDDFYRIVLLAVVFTAIAVLKILQVLTAPADKCVHRIL